MSNPTLAQRTATERHKPGVVLSRKEQSGQAMRAEAESKTPFFAPTGDVVQAKCADCDHEEKKVQAKPEPTQPAPIQAKCADCEHEDIHRSEQEEVHRQTQEEHPALQKASSHPTSAAPASDFSGGLTVGRPNDRFEQEADQMGEQVRRMPISGFSAMVFSPSPVVNLHRSHHHEEADIQPKSLPVAPALQRKVDGGLQTSGQFTNQVQTSAGGGAALAAPVQQGMESAFQADFGSVRIHTDTRAAQLSQDIGAKAFTYGNDIFFNENQYDPGSSEGRFLLAHELTHTVQQGAAVKRSVQPTGTGPIIQASLFDRALDWLADHFDPDVIPGYSLFSVIINYDFFRRRPVERNAENLVKGLLELIPGVGLLLYNLLHKHNIINRAFQWVSSELTRLNLNQNRIKQTFSQAWDGISFGATDLFDIGEAIDRNLDAIKRPFVALKNDVVSFAESIKNELLSMLKEALVSVLKELAVKRLRGYDLFTKVIGHDPITGENVNAPLEEILADFLDLIGKQQEREEMQKRGTLQKTADWLRSKLAQFMGLLTQFGALVRHLWEAFSFESLHNPMGVLNGLIDEATALVKNVFDFASEVALTVLKFIKDALLGWLRTHAHGIRGYKLLTVILGKDPVTDTPVERTAVSLIGGFVELVAGPEKFAEIEKSGAIERMIAWVESQLERFQITWEGIKQLFANIWNSLHIGDLINPIGAFIRVVGQFQPPIERLLGFIVEVVKKIIYTALELMNFPFDLIGQIVDRAMQAYEDIKRDPIAFLKNLIKAVQQGFSQFFNNIGKHLLAGLVAWLTSELKRANVQPPKDFSFRSILAFVLDVLGISMEKIWEKLAKHPRIGQAKVDKIRRTIDRLTGVWEFVKDVTKDGPGGIWKHIQEKLDTLWDTVLDQIKNWITGQIIDKMVAKLLSMLDPTGIMTVINGFIAFYKAVQSFIERLREILQVINSFVVGVAEIARGVVTKGADFLEQAMANALPTIIGFLANQVGLGGLGHKIGEMIQSVRELVDRGLTWLVNKAVTLGESALNALGMEAKPAESPSAVGQTNTQTGPQDFETSAPVSMKTSPHTLTGKVHGNRLQFWVASDPLELEPALIRALTIVRNNDPNRVILINALQQVREIENDYQHHENDILRGVPHTSEAVLQAKQNFIARRQATIANMLAAIANGFGITALNDFFKQPPSQRYIPRASQTEIGGFIRNKLYDNLHGWSSFSQNYKAQYKPDLIREIQLVQTNLDERGWQRLKLTGKINRNATITDYNPAMIPYHVDHIKPVAQLWNSSGKRGSDSDRRAHLLDLNNLTLLTEEANTAKGSGGILYDRFVELGFTSVLAGGGINGSTTIDGMKFWDASGQPIQP